MSAKDALLRTLAFYYALGHAPTRIEWIMTCESDLFVSDSECGRIIDALVESGEVVYDMGRFAFDRNVIYKVNRDEVYIPRKIRIAKRAAKWLASLSSVRFVALCNSAAFGHAEEGSDIDFFVITRAGKIMTTRALAVFPYKVLGRRPNSGELEKDAICLSYFVSEAGLDLSSHMLKTDDPYFRYWFLSLIPLYDDGVSRQLWNANLKITDKHPMAKPWAVSPDIKIKPRIRFPIPSLFENLFSKLQHRAFPSDLQEMMNQDSRVVVSPNTLKFHVNDGREYYRKQYWDFCNKKGVVYE